MCRETPSGFVKCHLFDYCYTGSNKQKKANCAKGCSDCQMEDLGYCPKTGLCHDGLGSKRRRRRRSRRSRHKHRTHKRRRSHRRRRRRHQSKQRGGGWI